jgi:hypothetical protein
MRDAETRAPPTDLSTVHSNFLAALWKRDWSGDDGFDVCVLDPETSVDSSVEDRMTLGWLQTKLPTLKQGTYTNYLSKNRDVRPVNPADPGCVRIHLLTKSEGDELKASRRADDPGAFWEAFRARYGNAVHIRLSVPGLSKDGKQALIYYVASFEADAAWGSYCLLKPQGARWEIVEEYCAWQA